MRTPDAATIDVIPTTVGMVFPDPKDAAETLHACPLCSGTRFRPLTTPGHWIGEEIFSCGADTFGLRRCQSCSLTFVNPRPTQVLLNTFYDSESYVCHNPEAGSTKTGRFLLESVARYGPYQDNQFLDFGCGGGFLLRAAMEDKWDAIGYDVGRRALDSCNSQGLTVTDNLAEIAPAGFDVVFLNHVFEHIAQPQGVLSLCHRLLSKSGKLFVVVPNLAGLRARLSFAFLSRHFNVDERHRAFPIHLFYFTPRTLVKTLESNGFRVAAVETFGLGMDEFVNHPEGGADGAMTPARAKTATAKKSSGFRQIVKGTLFSAALGENLLAVASPI